MEIDVFTLFPEAFDWFASQRHVPNAVAHGHRLEFVNYRDHTPLTGGQVDDTPFGGGAGMVLRVDVVEAALRARYGDDPVSLARPAAGARAGPGRDRVLDDALVDELAAEPALTLLCGRYEGFDERILEHFATDRVSIGRYVLAGGELPAMVVCDAVLRKLPGALGHADSAVEESLQPRRLKAVPSTRTTPGRPSSAAGRCRRCCCPATIDGSPTGAERRAAHGPPRLRRRPTPHARRTGSAPPRIRYHKPPRGVGDAHRAARPGARTARAVHDRATSGVSFAMSTVIESLERAQLRRVPEFDAGDRLRVHFQVIEGTRRRTQVFEGVVIKRQGHGARETFTVRKQSFGVGVERTFPLHSPKIERIEVAARGDVRRAKLYYLRGRVGKRARVRERRSTPAPRWRSSASCSTPTNRSTPTARPPRMRSRRAPRPRRRRAPTDAGEAVARAERDRLRAQRRDC